MPDIDNFILTGHAIQRALEMSLAADEITECLVRPEMICESIRGDGRHSYFGKRITAVVQGRHVVTFVWRTADDWKSDINTGGIHDRRFNEKEWI